MNLSEKMSAWEALKREIDMIEAEIKNEVIALGKTQKVGDVTASYTSGRGSYNYELLAAKIEPSDSVIAKHTKSVIDWRAVCEEAGATDEQKSMFYTAGSPSVSIKLEKGR